MARTTSGRIVCPVGPKGAGKSFWLKKYARSQKKKVLIFDSTGEYRSRGREGIPGLRTHRSMADFLRFCRSAKTLKKEAILASASSFESFCRFCYTLGDCVVIVEEASRYLTDARRSRAFNDLCDRSRHARIELVAAASRPMVMPVAFRNQVDSWVVFRTGSGSSLDFWRHEFDRSTAERIRNLKPHKHIELQP